jgi:RHS repeat-associated protein
VRVLGLGRAGLACAVVCGVLVTGTMSPVWAGEPGEPGVPPVVELGSFSVGDGVEGLVNEADGSFGVQIPVAGLSVSWDSRVPVDRYALGFGWGYGFAVVEVAGGVQASPSSGGRFAADESVPSGLAGYQGTDVVFRQVPGGVLAARADGVAGAREYAFELHELGGMVTYFNAAGDPVASVTATGGRTDWRWATGAGHHLASVVSVDGVVTELDWSDPGEVLVRPGVNVPADGGGGAGTWRLGLDGGRLTEVTDPVGGRSRVGYDDAGRIVRMVSGSGAVTRVDWRSDTDGVSRVDRVAVTDADGTELSARQWRQLDGALPTGWPAADAAGVIATGRASEGRSVELSDGSTRVVSEFDGWGRLTGKQVLASTAAGEQVVQEQQLTYPDGDPVGVGGLAGKPVGMEVRFLDASGGVRAGTESYAYDESGRMLRRQSADGTVLEFGYDSEIPAGRVLPVGAKVLERATATDGSMTTTESELDATRAVPVLVEQSAQAPGAEPVVTGRTEYTARDGVVVEQREFPAGDGAARPVLTRWDEHVDLGRGLREVTQTVAAGTDLESTTSSVSSLLHGGAVSSTDVLGRVSTASYDEVGRPVEARDAADRVTTTAYQAFAPDGVNTVTVTGPDGVSVAEVRDVLGRLVQKHDNLDGAGEPAEGELRVFERHGYPAPGVEEVTDAWGATTRIEQDLHGRTVSVELPNGSVQRTEYDDVAGTVTTGTTPTGRLADAAQVSTSRMDVAGRVVGTEGTRADGVPVPETTTVFDGFGREIETADGAVRTQVAYDGAGNAATTTISPAEPDRAGEPVVAERRFDGFGISLEKTMSAGGEKRSGGSRELDLLGRTVLETDQAGGTTRYEYTPDGLPARIDTSAGQVRTFTYDDLTRAVTESRVETSDGQAVVTAYAYDHDTSRLRSVFDPRDRAGTEISYTYDAFGNTRVVQYPADEAREPGAAISHEYDRHGRKTATIDVAGNRSEFAYADDGFLTGVVQTDASGRELARVGYTPDEYGRVRQITRGNGVTTAYEFTSAGQIKAETTTAADGTVHAEREYEYDPVTGNLLVRVDRALDEASGDLTVERREYRYDLLGRLIASTIRDGEAPDASVVQAVDYEIAVSGQVGTETTTDAAGERTVRTFAYSPIGALEAIATTGPDGTARVAAQEYDAAGNLIRGADGSRFEWDAANRQIAQLTPEGVRIESSHWADGTRKARVTEAGSTTYYWDDAALVNERHSTGPAEFDARPGGIASYLIGTSRHARITSAGAASPVQTETTYYATDRHGNVTELTDESGAVAGTYSYADYGVATSGPGVTRPAAGLPGAVGQLSYNPFQYSLEYTQADGTQFLSERTYDPTQMSFTRKDVESLHDLYGYVNANPIMLVDPTGRFSFWDFAAIGLNAIGAVGGLYGVFGALVATFTTAASGGTLLAIGILAGSISVANAAFAGMELYSAVSGIRFMSERDAFFTGLGLAGAGGFAAVGGRGALKLGRPGARSAVEDEGMPLRAFKDVTPATRAERDPYPFAPLSEWKALRATENLQDANPQATKEAIDAMRAHVRDLDGLYMKINGEDSKLMTSLADQLYPLELTLKSADLDAAYKALVKSEASIQALDKGTGSGVLPDAHIRTIWRADDQILAVRSAMSELDATARGLTTDGGKAFSAAVSRVRAYADKKLVTFDAARDKF